MKVEKEFFDMINQEVFDLVVNGKYNGLKNQTIEQLTKIHFSDIQSPET
jgi:hypothetical protein